MQKNPNLIKGDVHCTNRIFGGSSTITWQPVSKSVWSLVRLAIKRPWHHAADIFR